MYCVGIVSGVRGDDERRVNAEKREKYESRGITTSDRNITAVKDADVIIMAVKPQVLNGVCGGAVALVCG